MSDAELLIEVDGGHLGIAAVPGLARRLPTGPGSLRLDVSRVRSVDSAGAAFLASAARRARAGGGRVELVNLAPEVEQTLRLFPFVEEIFAPPAAPGFFEALGAGAVGLREIVVTYLLLCADIFYFTLTGPFVRRGIRWRAVLYEMSSMGSRALGVVGLIAFLVGGTMALQAAAQLRQFGANLFVVDLVGVSITRELGPLMAAIVVAGRSGSAVAAELATMVITEEVDAIRTMGLNPTRFLVVPKVIAIGITQPILTVLADALGIAGGLAVGALYLDVGPGAFIGRLREALFAKDIVTGLVKSMIFAVLIVSIGAFLGLRTRGGADEVGRTTTTSVVVSIFAVIVADAVASLVFYFGA